MSELKSLAQWRYWLGYRFRLAQDAPSYNQFSSILGDMAETIETAVRASDARIAELEAEVERLKAGPKVRPLEWDDGPNNSMASAETIFGAEYRAYLRRDGTWQLHLPPANLLGDFPSREAFKAAAQADYEARILSAFVQP